METIKLVCVNETIHKLYDVAHKSDRDGQHLNKEMSDFLQGRAAL